MTYRSNQRVPRVLGLAIAFGLAFGISAGAQDRMPPIAADKMTPAQKQDVEEYKKARGAEVSGPWAVLSRSEFVILMTARVWGQN
jgi:hypothetical protein